MPFVLRERLRRQVRHLAVARDPDPYEASAAVSHAHTLAAQGDRAAAIAVLRADLARITLEPWRFNQGLRALMPLLAQEGAPRAAATVALHLCDLPAFRKYTDGDRRDLALAARLAGDPGGAAVHYEAAGAPVLAAIAYEDATRPAESVRCWQVVSRHPDLVDNPYLDALVAFNLGKQSVTLRDSIQAGVSWVRARTRLLTALDLCGPDNVPRRFDIANALIALGLESGCMDDATRGFTLAIEVLQADSLTVFGAQYAFAHARLAARAGRPDEAARARSLGRSLTGLDASTDPLPDHLVSPPSYPAVWRDDVVAWALRGDPVEVCGELMADVKLPRFFQGRVATARLEAILAPSPATVASLVRLAASLGGIQMYAAIAPLAVLHRHPDPVVRAGVVRALRHLFFLPALQLVIASLDDPDATVRAAAVQALTVARYHPARGTLARLRDRTTDPDVLRAISTALEPASAPP